MKKRKKKRKKKRRSWEVMGSRSMGKLWVLRTLMKRILLMKILLMMRMTRLQRRSFWSITMCWEFNPMQHSRFFFRLIFLIFLTYWSTGDKEGLPSTGETTPPRQVERGECWQVFKKIVEAYGVERRKKKRRRMMILRNGKLMRKAKRSSGTVI